MAIQMQAKRRHVYAGRNIKAGQVYTAQSESNARFLEQVGHAQRYTPPAPTYGTRAMTAATPVPSVATSVAATPAAKPAGTVSETRKPRTTTAKPRSSAGA